jgi:hypothetical protein
MLFLASTSVQASKKSKSLKPENFTKKLTIISSSKSRTYYSLSSTKTSVINMRGPGTLRIITRGRFDFESDNEINYDILYSVDGTKQKKFKVRGVLRSKKANYLKGSLGIPAQYEDFEIKLGRGYHTLEFILKTKDPKVAVRYIFTPEKEKKREWIAYSPLKVSDPVDLITREETVSYYRFSKEKPLIIEVNGPTELRVLTRIENHYQMKGRIQYRIQLKEKEKTINTYQLSSRRSEIAVYKNDSTLIPGKAREFVIDVPRGKHQYEVLPLDEDKSTILGRLLLPKNDVKLEE